MSGFGIIFVEYKNCCFVNIDRTTLYNWKKNKPNLYKTIILGLKSKEIIEKMQQNIDELKALEEDFRTKK